MNRLIFNWFTAFLLISINSYSQSWECYGGSPTSGARIDPTNLCDQSLNYSPMNPMYVGQKSIRVMFHIFDSKNGGKNFNQNDPADIAFLNGIITNINSKFEVTSQANPAVSSPYIPNAKIKLVLTNIYYYNDDNLWNFRQGDFYSFMLNNGWNIYNNVVMSRTDLTDIQKNKTLHILIGGCPLGNFGGFAAGIPDKRFNYVFGYYNYRNYSNGMQLAVGHLMHEIGHNLSLQHNFQTQCDDCSDNGCPSQGSSNNTMDYTPGYVNGAFSQCQLGKMQYTLMNLPLSDLVIPDFCNHDGGTIPINGIVDWNGATNLSSDINVLNGGILTLNCKVGLPRGAKVVVKSGGTLLINGPTGQFVNNCGETLGDIIVENGGKLGYYSGSNISDYSIVINSGGNLFIDSQIKLSKLSTIDIKSGGYICVTNNGSFILENAVNCVNFHTGALVGTNINDRYGIPTCTSLPITSIPKTGLGSINLYNTDIYIQNESISNISYYTGSKIMAGSQVTTSKSYGIVKILNGSNVSFDADQYVILDKGFEIESGCKFEIRKK